MTKARNIAEFADDLSVSNGEVSIADLKPSQSMMFRNLLINGGMNIWQRGTTSTSPHTGYQTADRWGFGNNTGNSRSTDVPAGFQYSLDINGTVAGSSGYGIVYQRIESNNIIPYIGKQLTLSAYVKNIGTSTSNLACELYYANSSDNYVGGQTYISSPSSQPITSSWSRVVFPSFTVPANAANSLEIRLFRYDASNDQQWRITGIMLEEGSVATPFEQRPYGLELSLCQRYYLDVGSYQTSGIASGFRATDTLSRFFIYTPVEMRATPSFSNDSLVIYPTSNAPTLSTLTVRKNGNRVFLHYLSTGGTGVENMIMTSASSNYLNSEL